MKHDGNRAADVLRIAASVVLAALMFCAVFSLQHARAENGIPGTDIGSSDGDRDGDGMIEGPENEVTSPLGEALSDIGDSVSRGINDIEDGAESLASDIIGGVGTDGTGRGPVETDPGSVKDTATAEAEGTNKANAENDAANTLWVVAAVIAAVAAVAAVAVAIPKRTPKKDNK